MFDHERDGLVVRQFALVRIEFAVERFLRAQQVARGSAQLADEFAEFRFAKRRGDVVDLVVTDAALTEQAVGLATGASSRLLVNRDVVVLHYRHSR